MKDVSCRDGPALGQIPCLRFRVGEGTLRPMHDLPFATKPALRTQTRTHLHAKHLIGTLLGSAGVLLTLKDSGEGKSLASRGSSASWHNSQANLEDLPKSKGQSQHTPVEPI